MSQQLKMSEKRMYVLVPYNLSDIQKGIQAAHAMIEYSSCAWKGDGLPCEETPDARLTFKKYLDWADNHKTVMILNGGTTGKHSSMENYLHDLKKIGVVVSTFREPDLNDAMTAIAFVLDMEEDSHIIQYLKSMKLA